VLGSVGGRGTSGMAVGEGEGVGLKRSGRESGKNRKDALALGSVGAREQLWQWGEGGEAPGV
jgi:hypothetical protein